MFLVTNENMGLCLYMLINKSRELFSLQQHTTNSDSDWIQNHVQINANHRSRELFILQQHTTTILK